MKDRRPLIAGIQAPAADVTELEKQFVYGQRAERTEPVSTAPALPKTDFDSSSETTASANSTAIVPDDRPQPKITGRVPITTRTRPEIATALKQASLQRQLAGVEPCYVQDIMEEALELWLKAKGHL